MAKGDNDDDDQVVANREDDDDAHAAEAVLAAKAAAPSSSPSQPDASNASVPSIEPKPADLPEKFGFDQPDEEWFNRLRDAAMNQPQ